MLPRSAKKNVPRGPLGLKRTRKSSGTSLKPSKLRTLKPALQRAVVRGRIGQQQQKANGIIEQAIKKYEDNSLRLRTPALRTVPLYQILWDPIQRVHSSFFKGNGIAFLRRNLRARMGDKKDRYIAFYFSMLKDLNDFEQMLSSRKKKELFDKMQSRKKKRLIPNERKK